MTTHTDPTPLGALPRHGFVRERQLIHQDPPILPFSSATLWRKVRAGTFPRPVQIGRRITAWRAEDVRQWLAAQGAVGEARP
jgi:predicted DNA-binding transcriptional regulator AlpA